jgi:hypothetical protein
LEDHERNGAPVDAGRRHGSRRNAA